MTDTDKAEALAATLERNSLEHGGGASHVLHRSAREAATLLRSLAARVRELERAVEAERERCAQVCEQTDDEGEGPDCWGWHAKDYAKAIRALPAPPTQQKDQTP